MANLDTIYNQNYGSTVVTNGNFVAVGNPPWKKYSQCEGFSRIGEVFLIKNDRFNSKYTVVKTYTKKFSSENGYLATYYTEQSSSTVFTASFTKDDGNYNNTSTSCSYLVIEDDNINTYQSNYGASIDLCDYFLAIGDTGVTASFYTGYTSSFASVDIYSINSNYTYDVSDGIISTADNCASDSNSQLNNNPICVITGSISENFGKTVSITNNYLAVGAPNYNSGRGCVYIYKYTDSECIYELQAKVSCSLITYPLQFNFGSSICLDKATENTLVVGSSQLSQSNVYIFVSSSNGWQLKQTLTQNTSSNYYELDNANFNFFPSGSQINSRYGYSVSIHNNLLVVGAPNDLIYWEYSGSNVLRQRGSVYLYTDDICTNSEVSGNLSVNYTLLTKLYGDESTFKDNLFGFSVSTYNHKVLIGSPKPYFPFSTLFVSSSIDFYDNTFNQNNFGESTYCGQSLLYYVTNSNVVQLTTTPISKRKELGKPYSAFGYSVSVSDDNLVIGAPIPLNDDFHLKGLLITESGSAFQPLYKLTSSYQSEDCYITSSLVLNQLEECINCEYTGENTVISGGCDNLVIFVDEDGDTQYVSSQIFGKSFIYDTKDLQKDYHVGNVFYNNNKIIINNTGSILQNLTLDPTDFNNSYLYMDYQSQISLHEKQYICTIEPGEFNVSTNPSAITSSYFEYDILNKNVFDFNNLDIIMRYLNYRITNNSSEKWWLNFISGDVDESVFNYYTSSFTNYDDNRLTQTIKDKFCDVDLDINNDGVTNNQDAEILWKYFINEFTINNYQNYLNPRAKRSNYDNIVGFLNEKTGKFNTKQIKQEFFNFNYSSSLDITGSYLAPYITTVGLYSNQGELVAVAKLAQPIKNTSEIPINIVVKWDT